jgi:hypothetical protein
MSEAPNYTVSTQSDKQFIMIPIEVSAKGLKTYTLDLDEHEIIETGTKVKNGIPVSYMKFKLIDKK